ncbi:hypothetical protein D3C87_2179320 [compost metagenome]
MHALLEEFFCNSLIDSPPMGGILAVDQNNIGTVFGFQTGQHVLQGLPPYSSDDIADK